MIIFDQNPTFLNHDQTCSRSNSAFELVDRKDSNLQGEYVIFHGLSWSYLKKISSREVTFGHFSKNFFFEVQWSKWVANDPFRTTEHHKNFQKVIDPVNKSRHGMFSLCSHLVAVVVTYQTNISADSYIRWFRKNRFKVDPLNVFRGFTN